MTRVWGQFADALLPTRISTSTAFGMTAPSSPEGLVVRAVCPPPMPSDHSSSRSPLPTPALPKLPPSTEIK